jgi:hypothetical protein
MPIEIEDEPKGNKLADEAAEVAQKVSKEKVESSPKPKPKKDLPFKVKRWLTRNMAGCKHSTGFTADQIYEMLGL